MTEQRNTFNVDVCTALKRARLAAGKTQSQVAAEVNKDVHTIYQYENGLRSISTPTVYALASSLDTSPKNFWPEAKTIAAQVNQLRGNDGKSQEKE